MNHLNSQSLTLRSEQVNAVRNVVENRKWPEVLKSRTSNPVSPEPPRPRAQAHWRLWGRECGKVSWCRDLVPRVVSLSIMAAAGEKTPAHSRDHVTDLSTESGNLLKMAVKKKSEKIWPRGLETGEKQTKWRQRQIRKKQKICKNALNKPQEYGRMI